MLFKNDLSKDRIIEICGDFVLVQVERNGLLGIKNLSCDREEGAILSHAWITHHECCCNTPFPKSLVKKRDRVNKVLLKYKI